MSELPEKKQKFSNENEDNDNDEKENPVSKEELKEATNSNNGY